MAMEIGSCRLIPKRRRLAPASRSAGVRRYVGVDRLSDLPDGILGDIVSLLPIDDGVRTQILASRWRHIWRSSAPLNIDCGALVARSRGHGDADELRGLVSRILSSHRGTVRRFRVPAHFVDQAATIDAWLQSAALDNLQELDLWYSHDYLHLPLPRCGVSRFSTTLRVATIKQCNLPDSTVQGLQFPLLKQLELRHVLVSECSLNRMIASCPALVCLTIKRCFGFRCVRINSSLESICVVVGRPRPSELHFGELKFGELIIDIAPCLKRLLHLDSLLFRISVISAPKLETLVCRSSGNFDSTVLIQGLHIDSLTTVVRTVQVLAIDMHPLNLDILINLMRCFPCLERLYIKPCGSEKKCVAS
ncbi:putative F-box/LRR-repeat protein At5g02930 [Brachypodium distachyon]|uniref:putative F-box/LRR-repeat protein At5g02930 n=1 Tax=Brachypodium distachyon TaxID=15368 RepID=UPI00052FFCBC|nr:putative F-box/LRR-repeat protein At5g02930 [Brachypodium distachyon]|eukprot:XP_010238882.1 putative F-box/LRR-repeat protein At5g02930 [Brachypodium distachyon]